jgi:serine/threonine protein kinase
LAHPNVLPFIGIDAETFLDKKFLCMVSPWMTNGSLLKYLHSDNYEPAEDTERLVRHDGTVHAGSNIVVQLREISCGLAYLHAHKVVHGDIHGVWIIYLV